MKTPVFSRVSLWRSISLIRPARSTYASTSARRSSVVSSATSGCSGARTMKVAPKSVSGRVVKTRMTGRSAWSFAGSWRSSAILLRASGKTTSAPSLLPIQFSWAFFVVSDQSIQDRFSSRRSAYSVILKNHCARKRCSTGVPQRSHAPAITCSLASTVLHEGHQLTGASLRSASPASKSWRKIHWVHL